jgi:hypothetical protein
VPAAAPFALLPRPLLGALRGLLPPGQLFDGRRDWAVEVLLVEVAQQLSRLHA